MPVLGMVPFNMSLNLLCPDEALATYMALVLEFLRMTAFMLFQILLYFSAKFVANSTNKHLASVGFRMCHKVVLPFEIPVTAFFYTYPCSSCTVYDFMGSQVQSFHRIYHMQTVCSGCVNTDVNPVCWGS